MRSDAALMQGSNRTEVNSSEKRPETCDALLTITAGSKREALDGLADMVAAMKAAFANEGGGELYDVGNTPSALPCLTSRPSCCATRAVGARC